MALPETGIELYVARLGDFLFNFWNVVQRQHWFA